MTEEEKELEKKKYKQFLLKCPSCGNIFLPWRCLGILDYFDENGKRSKKVEKMREGYVCPKCGEFYLKEKYEKPDSHLPKKNENIKKQ